MKKEFITKDSGERAQFNSGMQRDIQTGKPRFDLILPKDLKYNETLLYRWAMLMTRGAEKYDERNWEKAEGEEELNRFKASAFRHFMQWYAGEDDEDHCSAIMFNLQGAEYCKTKLKGVLK
jgi:hypothetical protein